MFDANRVHCLWTGCYLSFATDLEAYNHACNVHIPELVHLPICQWQPSLHNTTSPCGFKFSLMYSITRPGNMQPSSPPLVMSKKTLQKLKQHFLIHFSPSLKTLPCPADGCPLLFRHVKTLRKHCLSDHVIQNLPEQEMQDDSCDRSPPTLVQI